MATTYDMRLNVLFHEELVIAAKALHEAQDVVRKDSSTPQQRLAAVQSALNAATTALYGCHNATHLVVVKIEREVSGPDREIIVKNNKVVEERTASAAVKESA